MAEELRSFCETFQRKIFLHTEKTHGEMLLDRVKNAMNKLDKTLIIPTSDEFQSRSFTLFFVKYGMLVDIRYQPSSSGMFGITKETNEIEVSWKHFNKRERDRKVGPTVYDPSLFNYWIECKKKALEAFLLTERSKAIEKEIKESITHLRTRMEFVERDIADTRQVKLFLRHNRYPYHRPNKFKDGSILWTTEGRYIVSVGPNEEEQKRVYSV